MAKRKDNIAYHNIRLNLDNEQHRRIHKVMAELNLSVHKSINQFLIEAADAYIRMLEGNGTIGEEKAQVPTSQYLVKEDLELIRREIKDELQKEMIGMLVSCLVSGKSIQIQDIKTTRDEFVQDMKEEDTEADDTISGLVSSWG